MDKKAIVNLTNKVSVITSFLLLYWVFIFSVSSIFGFQVVQEKLTASFMTSILSILVLLIGAIIVNIMFNLTIISEKIGKSQPVLTEPEKVTKKSLFFLFLLSFPLIVLLLYFGDLYTAHANEQNLIKSAKYLIENNEKDLDVLAAYSFNTIYIKKADHILGLLSNQDDNFPSLSVIIKDQIEDKPVFLQFGSLPRAVSDTVRQDYMFSCTPEERNFLLLSFSKKSVKYRFSAKNDYYKLFYPVKTENGYIMLYFTDQKNYGSVGS
ncbi:MAG TPA: hypothetical protein PLE74_05270 [Candidatus Cloacimonadota bacterium]|nr:hypothetical protein [Candidatus Cloacimonadota bacterium]